MYFEPEKSELDPRDPCGRTLNKHDRASMIGERTEGHFGRRYSNEVSNLAAQSFLTGKGGNLCCVCKQLIKGPVVQALGKHWHPNHFTCQHCKNPIREHKFNVYEGKPYCEIDYANLFLKRCNSCRLPIKDVVVVALNTNWHIEHFVCYACGVQLANKGFFEKDLNPFCQKCYEEKYCPRCKGCDESITDTAVMALGEKWHQTCFLCKDCSKPITAGRFEVVNNKPLCDYCSRLNSKTDIASHPE